MSLSSEVSTKPISFDKKKNLLEFLNLRYISLLKRKSFLFKKNYTDEEIISNDFIHKLYQDFLVTRTFLDYMSNILTSDLNGNSLIKLI